MIFREWPKFVILDGQFVKPSNLEPLSVGLRSIFLRKSSGEENTTKK